MDIIEAIDKFISSRIYHYALLINGKWGSGKTYFVKEKLIPHIKKNYDVTYLSLYGLKTTDEISQMLCIQAIKDKVPKVAHDALDSKSGQIATKVLSAFFRGGMNIIGAGDTGIESIVQALPDFDNKVIIFDDLERCGCPMNEVLGYINNFVEHSEASVILVANEAEMGKWQFESNPEMQTLIAMNPNVVVKLHPTMKDLVRDVGDKNNIKKTEFTPEEIECRRKVIFHSNEGYKAIKEKVIGLTINYEPDLKPIFDKLIKDNVVIEPLKSELIANVDWFVETAMKDDHRNLRTFQYFLEKITMIFEATESKYSTIHEIIIRYTFRSSVQYMKGLKMPEWEADYGVQNFGEPRIFFPDQLYGFRFIDDLILTNLIDKDAVNEILTRFARIAEKKGQLTNDPYQLIKNWWISEDHQLKEWLDGIEKNVEAGVYSTELYTDLIHHLAIMKAHNIMNDRCDRIFAAMEAQIKISDPSEIEEMERERFALSGKSAEIFKEKFETIEALISEAKQESEHQKYLRAVEDKTHWAHNLMKASENRGTVIGYSFIYWLEPEQIIELIDESDCKELYYFRLALQSFYDHSIYYEHMRDDYPHLQAVKDGFEKLDKSGWGEVKYAYEGWLMDDFVKYLKRIKPEE